MENYMTYLLKVNVILSLLFFIYYAILKKEKFFQLNRVLLIGIVIISVLLPLVPQLKYVAALEEHIPVMRTVSNFYSQPSTSVPLPNLVVLTPHKGSEIDSPILLLTLYDILIGIYIVIVVVLLLRLLIQLFNLFRLVRKYPKHRGEDGIMYYEQTESLSPFSFFNILFINRSHCNAEQLDQIIAHEKVHIYQWHTLDILFVEITQAIFWINPFVHVFKLHVKLNLEYIADECVLQQGINKKKYQLNILQSSLNPDMFSLTNMFNSSKLKLRIKMMNSRKTSLKNLYKYLLVLPVVACIYFAINPIKVSAVSAYSFDQLELKAFEGRYQFQTNKKFFLQVTAKDKTLVLHQLWDGKEIVFQRNSELEFSGNNGNFPLSFKKGNAGSITQLIAFKKDLWDKVGNPSEEKAVQLSESQLKALEGYYQFQNNGAGYIKFFVRDQQLIAQQMWDNYEHVLVAYSPSKFKSKEKGLPVEFIKDAGGKVTQALVLNRDLMNKVDEYKPVERALAKLTPTELKAVEGYYQFEKEKSYYVQIYAKGNDIILKQLWDGEERLFNPEGPLTFSSLVPSGKITFNTDQQGNVVQMISLHNEVLLRVKDYKPVSK